MKVSKRSVKTQRVWVLRSVPCGNMFWKEEGCLTNILGTERGGRELGGLVVQKDDADNIVFDVILSVKLIVKVRFILSLDRVK